MNIYLISQKEIEGYDYYDSAVVAADTEDEARDIHPRNGQIINWNEQDRDVTWPTHRDSIKAVLIGTAKPFTQKGVICSSFNAG